MLFTEIFSVKSIESDEFQDIAKSLGVQATFVSPSLAVKLVHQGKISREAVRDIMEEARMAGPTESSVTYYQVSGSSQAVEQLSASVDVLNN